MNEITRIAIRSERDSYHEGAEAGFWRGYMEGAAACEAFISGRTKVNPEAPPEFQPLGHSYYPINYAEVQR